MKLSHLLNPRLVLLKAEAQTLEAAIELALNAASEQFPNSIRRDLALSRVKEREALGGTLLPTGVAVPHARLDGFEDLVITALVPASPIPNPQGGQPIRMLWLLLTSKTGSSLYLQSLSAIAGIAKNEDLLERLIRSESPHRFMQIVEDAGFEVRKGLRVEDIMSREVVSIRETESLKTLIDLMYSRRLRYLPVTDSKGRLVGELGVLDLISAGIPDYAKRLEGLDFLDELEPMDELLANEDRIPVSSIMSSPPSPVAPETTVFEAALRMSRARKRHYPVVKDGVLVGVVSSMDILSKVLRT